MRRTSNLLLCLLVVLACGVPTTALSDQGAQPDATRVQTEFGYFVGTWHCDEKWLATTMWPAYSSTAILQATSDIDGVWLVWSYQQQASPQVRNPGKGADFWGYDPQTKRFVRTKIDNFAPGHFTLLTSSGWQGNTVAWEGDALTPNGSVSFKHTFTKVDDRTITGALYFAGRQAYSSKCTKG